MAKCKYCGTEIRWRQQGFKWIAESKGQQHNCIPISKSVLDARRREALDHQATQFLAQRERR